MMRYPVFCYVLIVTFCLLSCHSGPRQAEIQDIESGVKYLSLHDSLKQIDLENQEATVQQLYQSFGSFWEAYSEDILRLGPSGHSSTIEKLQTFLEFPDTEETIAAIDQVHDDRIEGYQEALDKAFRRFKFFFPDALLPDVVFYNSGFNYAVYPMEQHLGIGLDFYLGEEHPITEQLDPQVFPGYLKSKMRPELVVIEALKGWLLVHHQEQYYDESSLISTCIYWGKMMYLLDLVLPEESDDLKMGYSKEEQAWCKEYERNLWIEFSKSETVYESRKFEINRWVVDGPFTRAAGVPQNSPSRIGVWLGWQIVRDYMERNTDLSPAGLLSDKDYLKMMNAYRPG